LRDWVQPKIFGLPSIRMNCQDSRILCNSFHGKTIAAPSDRHACTGVRAFFVVGVSCTKQRAAREVSLKLRKLLCTRQELYHPLQEVSSLDSSKTPPANKIGRALGTL